MLAAGFDAGVRYGERLDRDMIAVPIGPRVQRFVSAAAPAYLVTHGRPEHPRDLLKHACIRHRFAHGVAPLWEFERRGEIVRINPGGPLVANTLELQLGAALSGLGDPGNLRGIPDAASWPTDLCSRSCRTGGSSSQVPFSTIRAAAICRRRFARS